ncbi:hypothetical protein BJY01DRAFT_226648 [Aspergillus pseudoustus]|uniref:Uncharacterized protein n=1 Tax=Aspergillus pseudoustus TaxID=1810923 RepID=A0ABR4IUB1_9EURO
MMDDACCSFPPTLSQSTVLVQDHEMGAFLSTNWAVEADYEAVEKQLAWRREHPPLSQIPLEADESAPLYTDFINQVRVMPHKDGSCLVPFAGMEIRGTSDWEPNLFEARAAQANEYLLEAVGTWAGLRLVMNSSFLHQARSGVSFSQYYQFQF